MRLTQILLTPVIMALLMLVGARVFRAQQLPLNLPTETASGSRVPSSTRSETASSAKNEAETLSAKERVAAFIKEQERRKKEQAAIQPEPDIISEPLPKEPETQRHVAALHPEMITPGNFEYLGAFMPPHIEENENSFAYSSGVIAFRPDPDRPETETTLPGSLFLTGHSQHQRVSEISIPKPFLSRLKIADQLPRAEQLQPFADVTHGILNDMAATLNGSEFRIGGLQVVNEQLHWTIHIYYNPGEYDTATHGMSSLNLDDYQTEGPWSLGDVNSRSPECHSDKHAGYIFQIPKSEADKWFGGRSIISGMWTATGLQNSSHGPSMFAYNLPTSLPAFGSIQATPLAWYSMQQPLAQHHAADRWGGGAWLTLGKKQAVIMVGQKALGPVYYGLARPEDCDENKGYHGPPYEAQMYIYSPASLIHAAHGKIQPTAIQPWMRWTNESEGGGFDKYLFRRCYRDISGVAYDAENSLLYLCQPNAGTTTDHPWHATPIIHVFRIVD